MKLLNGGLGQPIIRKRAVGDDEIARENRRIRKIQSDRHRSLAKQRGAFDDGRVDWRKLALELAVERYPGLRVIDEKQPPKLTEDPYFALANAVEHLLVFGKRVNSIPAALRFLSAQKDSAWYGKNPHTLKTRLYEFDAKRVKVQAVAAEFYRKRLRESESKGQRDDSVARMVEFLESTGSFKAAISYFIKQKK
jgi:hypothetical protein